MTSFDHHRRPLVVGIGSTTRAQLRRPNAHSALRCVARKPRAPRPSSLAARFCIACRTMRPEHSERTDEQLELIEAVRHADALIIATPGYHGGVSRSRQKRARHARGTARRRGVRISTAVRLAASSRLMAGQAAGSVLTSAALDRPALRGWPTPFGAGINTLETRFDECRYLFRREGRRPARHRRPASRAIRACVHRSSCARSERIGRSVQQAQSARLLHAV